jgi:hypothetical protein
VCREWDRCHGPLKESLGHFSFNLEFLSDLSEKAKLSLTRPAVSDVAL